MIRGLDGVAKIGANTIAKVTKWSYQATAADIASVTQDSDIVAHIAGALDGSGTIDVDLDPTDTLGQEALVEGATVTLNLYPDTDATGKTEYSGSVIVTGVSIDSDTSDRATASFTFAGYLTKGVA